MTGCPVLWHVTRATVLQEAIAAVEEEPVRHAQDWEAQRVADVTVLRRMLDRETDAARSAAWEERS